MKTKNIVVAFIFVIISNLIQSQNVVKEILFAKTEKEMYKIYKQLLDSAIILKDIHVAYHFYFKIESKDTLVKFEQVCYYYRGEEYTCERNSYLSYISNSQPISFYKRFLDYLEKLGQSDNIFYKRFSTAPLYSIMNILIRRYETVKLSQKERDELFRIIEKIVLRRINDDHDYGFLYGDFKYMTENIRQALINVIENPYYPESYLKFYLTHVVDTSVLDTTGIPLQIRKEFEKWKGLYVSGNSDYDTRLRKFYFYKRIGNELGISPGQAYIEENKKEFPEKGYLNINIIADYAYKAQDTILIKHLKEFKKKHPDYPLRHF